MKTALRILTITLLISGIQLQAAPVFETASTVIGDSASITIATPAGTQPGDLLVAALMLNKGKQIEVTTPSGWTLIRRSNRSRYIGMGIYYRVADESEPASYSFPLDEITRWATSISRISGVDLDDPIESSGSKSGRNGNVTAPSVTTRKNDALVLAFYTNRRDATYTSDASTTVRYDEPNTADGLPSNMLATFEQAESGATGSKIAAPSTSDRLWVGMQIAINGAAGPVDLSGFNISATGTSVAGGSVVLQIADAQDAGGTPLSGAVGVAIASNLDGLIFDRDVAFTDGTAAISITLATAGSHFLTAGIIGMKDAENLTLLVNRQPITLTADADQSKTQDDPDPALTYALTSGTLITGISLNGTPTRDPGEEAGPYLIQQGSLTDANNPNYAITFVSANFEIIPFVDLSGFSVTPAENSVAGDSLALSITDAKDASGNPLNGSIATAVASSLDVLVFDKDIVFTDGNASLSITLTTAASHLLTIGIANVNDAQNLTIAVSRRPLALTADAGQSKMQNDSDPALTYALTSGALITGISLNGTPTRDPGEEAGLYAIRKGSLTDANNPNYTITFVSADFEILPIETPPPPPPETGIWSSAAELAALPMSGEPWQALKDDADTYWGIPNLSDQEDKANIYTMSKALVYARTGIESYRTEVIDACMQAIDSEDGGRALALARNLAAFVIAADLVGLPPEEDAIFRDWLETVRFEDLSGGTLLSAHEDQPDNPGTHAGASHAAVAVYLNDQAELDHIAQVFKGWLGDRGSYADFAYGDLDWQSDPDRPIGINPIGAVIQGYNVDGVLPDEQRKAGGFTWPPPKRGSVYESLQGALLQAIVLHRAGYDVWNWEDRALLRAFTWLHDVADYPAAGDDLWQPFIINYYYGTDFPTPSISRPGKNIARTCWTHSGMYIPPVITNPPPTDSNLEYYPGDYSSEMILGNSLPGTWRPFSADSPWNTPIPADAATHPDSGQIMSLVISRVSNIRLVGSFLTPIWVVNSENALPAGAAPNPDRPMDLHWVYMKSVGNIYETWDRENDKWADVPIPLATGIYSQPTADGQMCIIDPFNKKAYEMSRYYGWTNDTPNCTTFNIWDLSGSGVGEHPSVGDRWQAQGGKGSGFPLIAGLIRPEELAAGEIRHALHFSFGHNRDVAGGQIMMYPPACRSDGVYTNTATLIHPIEGMRFQLDPSLTEADFDQWGLTREGKVVARALQTYGMFLGNNGGDFKVAVQQLGTTAEESRAAWDELAPDFYSTVRNIPSDRFRVIYTGEPTIR